MHKYFGKFLDCVLNAHLIRKDKHYFNTLQPSSEGYGRKYIDRTPRNKKPKGEAMLDVDENTGHWTVDIHKPTSDKN